MERDVRWAILVVGMHRSGTSAITNALGVLGADLPLRLMPGAEGNPTGHFEPEAIVALNDQVLAAAGSSWFDWRKFPDQWFSSPECERLTEELLAAVRTDFGDSPCALIKDPRLCRILPLWKSILDRLGYRPYFVLPYRNPIEVAQSLARRNGFGLFHGYMLWLRHVLDAEFATREFPRVFVAYEDLLAQPASTVSGLASRSPIARLRERAAALADVDLIVRDELRHNRATESDLAITDKVPAWVREAYASYQALRLDADDKVVGNRLDNLRGAFDEACETFAPAIREVELRSEKLLNEKEAALHDAHAMLAVRSQEAERNQAEAVALRTVLSETRTQLDETRTELSKKSETVNAFIDRLSSQSVEISQLKVQLASESQAAAELRTHLAALSAEAETVRMELAVVRDAAASAERDIAARSAEADTLRKDLTSAAQSLADARAETEAVRIGFLHSRSWRATSPLRWLSRRLFR